MYQDGNRHDIMFLLSELCVRQTGPDVERAWRAIRIATEGVPDQLPKSDAHLWKPLQKLMAKAEAERRKALTEQREHIPSNLTPATNTQPFPAPEEQPLGFDFRINGLDPLHTNAPHNGPPELHEADPFYMSNPGIPAAEDSPFIGNPPHSDHAGYSRASFGAHGVNPAPYSATSEFSNPLADQFSSLSNINTRTDSDSLDWVMQDDMAHHLVLQAELPANGNSDEFPNALGRWTNLL